MVGQKGRSGRPATVLNGGVRGKIARAATSAERSQFWRQNNATKAKDKDKKNNDARAEKFRENADLREENLRKRREKYKLAKVQPKNVSPAPKKAIK